METRDRQRGRILLAEDDPAMRDLLTTTLRCEGYSVVPTASGTEVLERLGTARLGHRHFDAIVSDIRMPGPSGLDVLWGLRHAGDRVPIVLITAFGSNATHARALQLGASAILDKPFPLEALVAVVDDVVRPRGAGRCHACRAAADLSSTARGVRLDWCIECWDGAGGVPDDRELGVGD